MDFEYIESKALDKNVNELNLNGTSSSCESKVEGEVEGSRSIGCICYYQLKKHSIKKKK